MNISKLILAFATIFFVSSFAAKPLAASSGNIVRNPDIAPIYTGGPIAMHHFIATTLRYPADAFERRAQGLVVYAFVVEKDGTLSDFRIIRTADPALDAEALRILQAMPPWQPARHNGEVVRAEASVPMFFSINPNATSNVQGGGQQHNFARTDLDLINNNTIFTIVDRMPEFATGRADLANFISRVLRYPRQALEDGIEGRVLCSFIVSCDGSISNIEVVNSDNELLNEEAIRVISVMPRWTPGERNGERVHVRMLLPIDFVIDEEPIPTGF
jgi:TonB family protein